MFEVPFFGRHPVDPVPIKAMGRFEHEACAIDPSTGIVYMTEDNGDPADGFYRYIPDHHGQLHRGGRLQMLAVQGRSGFVTYKHQTVGEKLQCEWVEIDDPDPRQRRESPGRGVRAGRRQGRGPVHGPRGRTLVEGQRLLRRQ